MIVSGNLTGMLDRENLFKARGETIFFPLVSQDRAWNETDEEVIFIEVQTVI